MVDEELSPFHFAEKVQSFVGSVGRALSE
jgi:hypothetical protein